MPFLMVGPQLGTMVASSRWCMRRQFVGHRPTVFMLTGIEAFRALGWDIDDWATIHGSTNPFVNTKHIDDGLLLDMAMRG